MDREIILKNAIKHTCGEREDEYGEPFINMTNTAQLIEAYINAKFNLSIILSSTDAAFILTLVKMARTFSGSTKPDTFEDAAAYVAIAGECAALEIQ